MKEEVCGICLPEYFCIEISKGRYKFDNTAINNTFSFIKYPINECPILREDQVTNTEDKKV